MRYESTELGQQLATLAENDELELPNASDYMAKDYAIAVDAHLAKLHRDALNALESGEPGELRNMAKHLKRHCDMSRCFNPALPDDIFCKHHRAVEDAMIVESAENKLPF
jgi:hypothetical protein